MLRMPARGRSAVLALGILCAVTAISAAAVRSFNVNPARSYVLIEVGKTGILAVAGHTHEVRAPIAAGRVALDSDEPSRSTVRLEIDAEALRVTGKGDSPGDVPDVQRTMLSSQVLDVERYPKILFQSTAVAVTRRTASTLDLAVTGTLTLHGIARPLSVPVHVTLAARGLSASGSLTVKQTDYGITPISVKGVVRVKDELDITFDVVADE
jgi:polyisoprenoid-binding protein YceI